MRFFLVEVTRLELAASASRTQRSTKLSHTSIRAFDGTKDSIVYPFQKVKQNFEEF